MERRIVMSDEEETDKTQVASRITTRQVQIVVCAVETTERPECRRGTGRGPLRRVHWCVLGDDTTGNQHMCRQASSGCSAWRQAMVKVWVLGSVLSGEEATRSRQVLYNFCLKAQLWL